MKSYTRPVSIVTSTGQQLNAMRWKKMQVSIGFHLYLMILQAKYYRIVHSLPTHHHISTLCIIQKNLPDKLFFNRKKRQKKKLSFYTPIYKKKFFNIYSNIRACIRFPFFHFFLLSTKPIYTYFFYTPKMNPKYQSFVKTLYSSSSSVCSSCNTGYITQYSQISLHTLT